ncbi:hypothetical protein CO2235_U1010043 [Cupriavidus oxalaticus]|uniref:Uncharacterized protein n=1 Tax=Cupriavidus oxalaticus TaxID=96344 RepID=A0A375FJJ1_9BURK|nr:hypothetical protein CO2235_U1010043 [Cupriavidus oxalaticus]
MSGLCRLILNASMAFFHHHQTE